MAIAVDDRINGAGGIYVGGGPQGLAGGGNPGRDTTEGCSSVRQVPGVWSHRRQENVGDVSKIEHESSAGGRDICPGFIQNGGEAHRGARGSAAADRSRKYEDY